MVSPHKLFYSMCCCVIFKDFLHGIRAESKIETKFLNQIEIKLNMISVRVRIIQVHNHVSLWFDDIACPKIDFEFLCIEGHNGGCVR